MIEEKIKMWAIFTDGPHTNKNLYEYEKLN